MNFLEDLIVISNDIKLHELTAEMNLDDKETIKFIQQYNKVNNRLFTKKGGKQYMIDEYRKSVLNYNKLDCVLNRK